VRFFGAKVEIRLNIILRGEKRRSDADFWLYKKITIFGQKICAKRKIPNTGLFKRLNGVVARSNKKSPEKGLKLA